jgi:hypothetical protein
MFTFKETKVDKTTRYFPGLPKAIRGGLVQGQGTVLVFGQNKVQQYDTNRKSPVGPNLSIKNYLGC